MIDKVDILLQLKIEEQHRYIQTLEKENKMLTDLLLEIGAEIGEEIRPTMEFATTIAEPMEMKLVRIDLHKTFLTGSCDLKKRIRAIDEKLRRGGRNDCV